MDPVSPVFRLGKNPAQPSQHALRFKSLLKKAGPVPATYSVDAGRSPIPTPMFANDRFQNCVIAAQAHQTLRFELREQRKLISIKDADVNAEYFRQTGGEGIDTGLAVAAALEQWRTRGWQADGRLYRISAYATVDFHDPIQVRQAVFADVGVGIGIQLPLSAKPQLVAGQPWAVIEGPTAVAGSWGGHYVYVCGYTATGPVCVTWGRKQQMTWQWLATYADEAFATFDAANSFNKGLVDLAALRAFAKALP